MNIWYEHLVISIFLLNNTHLQMCMFKIWNISASPVAAFLENEEHGRMSDALDEKLKCLEEDSNVIPRFVEVKMFRGS